MIRLNDKELKQFSSDFKDEILIHWKENVLNQSYGYEILQDIPPYSMTTEWKNKNYILFDVDDIFNPLIGYYIQQDKFLNSFDHWINQIPAKYDDLINLKYIMDHTELIIDEELKDDMFERILNDFLGWVKNNINNGNINVVPLSIKIIWEKEENSEE